MANFFKAIDVMSYHPKMKISGKNSYKTVFGGLLTSSLFILSIIGLIYFGRELWEKKDPSIISSVVDYEASKPYRFGPNDFYGFFTLQDKNFNTFIDDSIYTIVPTQIRNYKDENGKESFESKNLEYDRCINYSNQLTNMPKNLKVDYENAYCIKPNSGNITGLWGTNLVEEIYIAYYKCDNKKSKIKCKSPEEIYDKIDGGYITLNLLNNQLQPKNFSQPIKSFLSNTWNNINLETYTEMLIYLKELNILTDDGFLIKNKKILSSYSFEDPRFLYYRKNIYSDTKFYQVAFKREYNGIEINRVYIKIQEIVTKFGGLIKFLSVVGQLIISLCSEIEFYNDFSFNLNERLKNAKLESSIYLQKKVTIDDSKIKITVSQNNYLKKVDEKDDSEIEKDIDNSKNQNLNIREKFSVSNNKFNKSNLFKFKKAEDMGEKALPNLKTLKFTKQVEGYEKKTINIMTFNESNKIYSSISAFKNFIQILCCFNNEFTRKIKNLTLKNKLIISQESMIEKYFQVDYILDKLKKINEEFNEQFNDKKIEYEYLEKIHENFDKNTKNLFFY